MQAQNETILDKVMAAAQRIKVRPGHAMNQMQEAFYKAVLKHEHVA